MQDRDPVAEPRLESTDRLRGQSDLRHQHDRRAAPGQHFFDHSQVHLGLARTGHPGKQHALPRLRLIQLRQEAGNRRRLGFGQFGCVDRRRADSGLVRAGDAR